MGQLQQKILSKRRNGAKAAIIWPLVLYSLIQLAANLFPTSTTATNNLLSTRPQLSVENINFAPKCHTIDGEVPKTTTTTTTTTTSNLKSCSSTTKISLPLPLLSSSSSSESLSLSPSSLSSSSTAYQLAVRGYSVLSEIFSSRKFVLLAEATSFSHHNHHHHYHHPNQDKGIIILNSTNFNTELIQYNHPFPHLKLIEYYVAFCRACGKFKSTYAKLAKEIQPWRNVIRPSAIDLSISTNSPIAHSWSVEIVPTMRIHPPPNHSLAENLDKQLSTLSSKLSQSELQKAMFSLYNSSNLMVQHLEVQKYMDKVSLLKSDLVHYIERYVQDTKPSELPSNWPNLKPVTETSLLELYRNHPRQELFLIIEGPTLTSVSDQSSSGSMVPSLGLQIMLELSSKAPWKAIRYVRASENRALIEDVITQQKRVVSEQSDNQIVEQVNLLNNLLSNNNDQAGGNNNNILLVHVDDSHSPNSTTSASKSEAPVSAFPFMTIVTSKDLLALEQSITVLSSELIHQNDENKYEKRTNKRDAINHLIRDRRATSSSSSSIQADYLLNNMSSERKLELFALHIQQTYTETNEDRVFVKAINSFDQNSRSDSEASSLSEGSSSSQNNKAINTASQSTPKKPIITSTTNSKTEEQASQKSFIVKDQSLLNRFFSLFSSSSEKTYKVISSSSSSSSSYSSSCDYEDKLKAIRYLLFNEIPRASMIDKNLREQQEKLSILVNLITVIKSYFPLPDLPSIQFIDGVQNYLIKQQTRLASLTNINQETGNGGFDTRAFKQELKRLESEDKRLPEVKEWKHCRGYPCALWRLFHTLTAFEYKKLSQIRQPSTLRPPQPSSSSPSLALQTSEIQPILNSPASTGLQQSDNNLSPSVEAITMNSSILNSPLSPVERLVSPPSTTTSLSLTIVAPSASSPSSSSSSQQVVIQTDNIGNTNNNNKQSQPQTEADLPTPVILVMRDYITNFFSCLECATQFRLETADLSFERIRQQEPAEFSILWLWETHNRVNKRLSVDLSTNPPDRPKVWYPTFDQCATCYKKAPSFLQDKTITSTVDASIFHESIEWNKQEVLCYLLNEFTKQPMDSHINLFGDEMGYGFRYIIVTCIALLLIIVLLRCTTCYIERQRRHKATLLNGNGAHYSLELH